MSPNVQLSCEPWGHADHIGEDCGCLSSDSTGAYVHGLSLIPREYKRVAAALDWTTHFSLELVACVILWLSVSSTKPFVSCIAAVLVFYISAVHGYRQHGYSVVWLTDSDLWGQSLHYACVQ